MKKDEDSLWTALLCAFATGGFLVMGVGFLGEVSTIATMADAQRVYSALALCAFAVLFFALFTLLEASKVEVRDE